MLAMGRPVVVTAWAESPLGALADECAAVFRVDPGDFGQLTTRATHVLGLDDAEYRGLTSAALQWAARHDRSAAVRRTLDTVHGAA